MTCSFEYVKKLAVLKRDDTEGKMKTLANIVSYEAVTDADTLNIAKEAGITVYSYD